MDRGGSAACGGPEAEYSTTGGGGRAVGGGAEPAPGGGSGRTRTPFSSSARARKRAATELGGALAAAATRIDWPEPEPGPGRPASDPPLEPARSPPPESRPVNASPRGGRGGGRAITAAPPRASDRMARWCASFFPSRSGLLRFFRSPSCREPWLRAPRSRARLRRATRPTSPGTSFRGLR